jgi:hypothetical protein
MALSYARTVLLRAHSPSALLPGVTGGRLWQQLHLSSAYFQQQKPEGELFGACVLVVRGCIG